LIFWSDSKFSELFSEAKGGKATPKHSCRLSQPFLIPMSSFSPSSENIRVRHIVKGGDHYYMLFNEDGGKIQTHLTFSEKGGFEWLDPKTGRATLGSPLDPVSFGKHEFKLLRMVRNKLGSHGLGTSTGYF